MKNILHPVLNFLILLPTMILLYQPILKTRATGHLIASLCVAIIGARLRFLPKGLFDMYKKINQQSLRKLFWIYYLLIRILSIIFILFLFSNKSETNLDLLSFYLYIFIYLMYDMSLTVMVWRKVDNSKKLIKYTTRIFIVNSILGGIFGFLK